VISKRPVRHGFCQGHCGRQTDRSDGFRMKDALDSRLADWQRMTTRLEQLRARGDLGEAEFEMIAALKYSSNLLLREQVLLHARHVAAPSEELIGVLLDVVCNRRLFVDERTLAAQALMDLAPRFQARAPGRLRESEMITKLAMTLDLPEAQVFRQAVTRVIDKIRADETGNPAEG
jgi:hypothetical protein